jgi:Flp pilus assembly protein TadD
MNKTAFKIAASTLIVALTMVGSTAQSEAMRRLGSARRADSRTDLQAANYHEQARQLLQQGQIAPAMMQMETAVALAPRDAGYRLLLADIYMKSGRFESARRTFADVVELDSSNTRAALSLALMEIALGRPQAALGQLDELSGRASPADVGLAYALAGMPERAIEILEPAARSPGATPRLRQNLALSYALAGDWQRARTVASQDVSPADLGARMQQWATMARPDVRSNQVAALLGVNPVQDSGQPVRLALSTPTAPTPEAFAEATAPAPAAFAQADVQAVAPTEIPASAAPSADSSWGQPVQFAEAAPSPVGESAPAETRSYYLPAEEAPAPATEAEVRFAAAAETVTRPNPAVVRNASASLPTAPVFQRAAPQTNVRGGNSRFVVQLGAFSNEGNAERAWQQASQRFALDGRAPLTTTIDINGRTLHRVSVAGFASQTDAARMCGQIRASGGACFVRPNAGDASVRWAARYAPDRNRRA